MPTYVVLGKFTQDGIKSIHDSPKRLEAARRLLSDNGGKLKDVYYTMGRYDIIAICEAPDEKVMTRVLLAIGSQGMVSTETLSALSAKEVAAIVQVIP